PPRPPLSSPLSLHDALPIFFHAHVERVPRGEVEAAVNIVYRQAARLRELDQRVEALGLPADELRDDHRVLRGGDEIRGRGEGFRDRKSTRLNSSHVSISYAV